MKNSLVAFALLFSANAAHADFSTCGTVTMIEQGAHCEAGQMCPMFMRLVPFLVVGKEKFSLDAANEAINQQILDSQGQSICVTGEQAVDGSLQVETLTPAAALQ